MPALKVFNGTAWEYLTGGAAIVQQPDPPASPVAGDLWIDTDEAPSGGLSSILAYAERTVNQGSITTQVDLTGLSVTVTLPAGRRILIRGRVAFSNTAADNRMDLNILEGAAVLQRGFVQSANTPGNAQTVETSTVISPSAGTHTYKLAAARGSGAGTVTMEAGADFPAYIIVEDITGSLWPAGQSVDVGMLPVLDQCTVHNTAAISIPDNVSTAITFNSERYDPRDMHSTASLTDRVNILRTGVYHIQFTGQMAGASDYVQVLPILQINGTSDIAYGQRVVSIGTNPALINVSKTIKLTVGDYVRALVYQDNTANAARNLEVNGFISPELSVSYIGPG